MQKVRSWAEVVAVELQWPNDWLNDAVKGYFTSIQTAQVLFVAPGITVHLPPVAQLLAMKLSAWRDKLDIDDAARLLQAMPIELGQAGIWAQIEKYLLPGRELKARYAFEDLWELVYGQN